jgi:hypothetical protein
MTNTELLALLREARESVEEHEKALLYDDPKVAALIDLATRMDAALAAHERGAEERTAHLNRVWWDALHQASREGLDLSETERRAEAAVEAEARRAATAAARGMK